MFTGLVEGVACVRRRDESEDGGATLWLERLPFEYAAIEAGESIAINGCCLTAARFDPDHQALGFDLLAETLAVTNLGDLREGDGVNLERALSVGARLGGHFVQGHVDATRRVKSFGQLEGGDWELALSLEPADLGQVLPRGSIALDGISLTAARVDDRQATLSCFIIPHTRSHTRLREVSAGERLNIEFDMLGKFVRRQQALDDATRSAV